MLHAPVVPAHQNPPVTSVSLLWLSDMLGIPCRCVQCLRPCPANNKLDAIFQEPFGNADGVSRCIKMFLRHQIDLYILGNKNSRKDHHLIAFEHNDQVALLLPDHYEHPNLETVVVLTRDNLTCHNIFRWIDLMNTQYSQRIKPPRNVGVPCSLR